MNQPHNPSELPTATHLPLHKGGGMYGCSQSAKVGASYGVNYISNGVGRWLAAAVEINENKTAFG